MPKPEGLARFDSLGGVQVHWGSIGRTGTRELMPDFLEKLSAAFDELWTVTPDGKALAIISLGAFVSRPPKPGDRHATGTAFDLASIYWAHDAQPIHAHHAVQDARRYLAVEAILRRHCPQVLDWWFNDDHHNHWHIDDRPEAAGFSKPSRSDVLFVQAVIRYMRGVNLTIDGIWGPQTEAAMAAEIGALKWHDWLLAVARAGFAG